MTTNSESESGKQIVKPLIVLNRCPFGRYPYVEFYNPETSEGTQKDLNVKMLNEILSRKLNFKVSIIKA